MLNDRFIRFRPLFSVALMSLLWLPALAQSQPTEDSSELSAVEFSTEKTGNHANSTTEAEEIPIQAASQDARTDTDEGTPKVSMGILRAELSKSQLKALDLQTALQIALEQNPSLKEAHDHSNEAKAHYWSSLAGFLPDVGVAYSFSNYKGAVQSLNTSLLKMNRGTVSPQLFFQFNLLQGGAQIFTAIYNKRLLEAQRLSEQAMNQEIVRETTIRYYELERRLADLRAAQLQLEEIQENLAASQNPKTTMVDNASLGLLQLQTQQSEAEEQLTEAESASEASAVRLNEMLALPAFVDLMPTEEQEVHTLLPIGTDFQACLSQAMANNPSLKAQEKQLKAYQHLLKAALVTAVLPEVQTSYNIGSVGASRDETGRYNSQASRVAFTNRNMGLSGLFGYREIRAKISALRNQLATQRNEIQRVMSEAQVQSRARLAQVDINRERVALAQKARQLALAQLKTGKSTALELLQAQAMLNKSRYHMNDAILQYNESQVEIAYAMGAVSANMLAHGFRPPFTPSVQVSNNFPVSQPQTGGSMP